MVDLGPSATRTAAAPINGGFNMIIKLCMLACATLFMAVPAMAQGDPPPEMMEGDPHHGPEVLLGIPEGVEPPEGTPMPETPEEGLDLFFDVLAGPDGVVDKEDFMAWVRHFHMPPPEEMMGDEMDPAMDPGMDPAMGDPMGEGMPPEEMGGMHEEDPELSGLPHPPECSTALRQQEMGPQEEGFPCGDHHDGNLVFRTICNMEGFDMAAITLPEDRGAGCFGIEALRGHIDFQIVEVDGTVIWDTSMGKEAFDALKLEGGPGAVYHIQTIGGSPDGSATVRFVDVNTGDM